MLQFTFDDLSNFINVVPMRASLSWQAALLSRTVGNAIHFGRERRTCQSCVAGQPWSITSRYAHLKQCNSNPLYRSRFAAPHWRRQILSSFTKICVSYRAITPAQSLASHICFPGSFHSSTSCIFTSTSKCPVNVSFHCSLFHSIFLLVIAVGILTKNLAFPRHCALSRHRNMPKKKLPCGRSWRTRKRPDARQGFASLQVLILRLLKSSRIPFLANIFFKWFYYVFVCFCLDLQIWF